VVMTVVVSRGNCSRRMISRKSHRPVEGEGGGEAQQVAVPATRRPACIPGSVVSGERGRSI